VRHASASVAARLVQAEVDRLLAQVTLVAVLALASERVAAQVNAAAVVAARVVAAHAGLLQRALDRAGPQLLVPEEHVSALGHQESILAGALQEHVAVLAGQLEELLASLEVGE